MGFAPLLTIQEQHISSLRLGHLHLIEMFLNIIACKLHVLGEHLAKFIHPLIAFWLVRTNQRIHGQHIHLIIMTQAGFLVHSVTQPGIIDNMVASDQPGQVKGFGRRIHGNGAVSRILRNHLGRDMFIFPKDQIGPDLIGNHIHIMFLEKLHSFFQFPTLPDATCWIMGTAHNAGVNVIFHNLLFHVGKVHAPYIFLVFFQSTVYNVVSIISKSPGKSHISWRMHQHAVPF